MKGKLSVKKGPVLGMFCLIAGIALAIAIQSAIDDSATTVTEEQAVLEETTTSASVGEVIEDHVGPPEQQPAMGLVAPPDADGDPFGDESQEELTADPSS